MEIKTIFINSDKVEKFDNYVNSALKEGWKLVKRELIIPQAQPVTRNVYFDCMLYAELERGTKNED